MTAYDQNCDFAIICRALAYCADERLVDLIGNTGFSMSDCEKFRDRCGELLTTISQEGGISA